MGASHSIAVQNFNVNIGILVMVGLYALMIREGISAKVRARIKRPRMRQMRGETPNRTAR